MASLQNPAGETPITFGPCQVFPYSRRLLVDGVPVPLGSRAFELLMVLAEVPGQVVGKDELFDRLWPGLFVEEANLRVQVGTLRKALGRGGDLIRTVPGRGYGLVAADPAAIVETVAAAGAPTNLPELKTAMIGRAGECDQLRALFDQHRLVTLVGAGGMGKTRLAIEFGRQARERYPAGVWLVDLAAVGDGAVVASAVAAALGIPLRGAAPPVDAVAAALDGPGRLLILDNCEHLADAVAALAGTLLTRAPALAILVTSQESLRIAPEKLVRLAPLAVPPAGVRQIAEFPAVALFVARARGADRQFVLDDGNAADVAEICRRLDGVPLALEIAAAQLPALGLATIEERLRLLETAPGDGAGRHQTLRSLAEWSHNLLGPAEQRIFRRLAIFAGSFSLDAAITVARDEGASWWDTADALGQLVDKSLLMVEPGEPPRYRLLETLRLYAADRLEAAGERHWAAARHAQFFAEFLDTADTVWESLPELDWLRTYRGELDQVRAALDWALPDAGRADIAISLAGTAVHLFDRLVLYSEGRAYAERAAALIGPATAPGAAARLLRRTAALWFNTDRPKAFELAARSVELYRQAGDEPGLAQALIAVGSLHMFLGRPDDAKAALGEALAILSETGHRKSYFNLMCALGMVALFTHDGAGARDRFAAALGAAQALKDRDRESHVLMNLAEIEFSLGHAAAAAGYGRRAVEAFRPTTRHTDLGVALINLAAYLLVEGEVVEGRRVAEEALARAQGQGGFIVRICLRRWALLGALEGRHAAAARLQGFLDAGHAAAGDRLEPTEQRIRDHVGQLLAAALSPEEIGAGAAAGAGWSEPDALAFVAERLAGPK